MLLLVVTDSNIIVVPLLSQDIMGLGFNVDGNMKEGIFVSKLHKRGPAHDTGLISVGDRIMSVTVSFENMVLEDAMTILSYASPYPVKLCLQRPSSIASRPSNTEEKAVDNSEEEDVDINHPVYRSQSLDDLRQINKEGLLHPRRTWSEWKRAGYVPNKPVEEGHLKKWKGKADIVEETSESGDLQTQSSASNYSIPDLKIDIHDLRMDSDDGDVPTIQITEAEVTGNAKVNEMNIEASEVAAEVCAEDGNSDTKITPEPLDPDVSVSPSDESEAIANDVSPSEDVDNAVSTALPDGSMSVSVPTEKPPAVPNNDDDDDDDDVDGGKVVKEESIVALGKSSAYTDEAEGQDGNDEGSVGDVIRDYFSNSPTILQQFGLTPNGDQQVSTDDANSSRPDSNPSDAKAAVTLDGISITAVTESKSEMVAGSPDSGFMGTRPTDDNEIQKTSASSNSSASSGSASPSQGDEGVDIDNSKKSSLISRKVGDGLVFDIKPSGYNDIRKEVEVKPEAKSGPKGGLAYYVSIDDHGTPSHAIRPIAGVDLSKMDLGQPELIRPKPSGDSTLIQAPTSTNSYEGTKMEPDTKVSRDENDNSASLMDTKSSKLTVQLDGSSNSINSLSSSSNKEYRIEKSENVTIIKQNDVPEAFTVTLTREDSEA
ncbi:hypothetical protein LSH36_17g09024 [Paralvinella palmiformis]|uniref:PDZ domain-containing protein n=1 Tax=Paralvinella palmiformis TaxID=53620 RepID=A0AAD9KC00_9ANNE|nr:hypothetical protein LSH36_17g09024 [Paralvinella palmiformis]